MIWRQVCRQLSRGAVQTYIDRAEKLEDPRTEKLEYPTEAGRTTGDETPRRRVATGTEAWFNALDKAK